MPLSSSSTVLCRYGYDPLDRQVDCAPSATGRLQRFYCKTRLANEIQGAVHRSIFQHDDQLLAQQLRQNGKIDTTLLATDQQRSVINALDAAEPHPLALTPYGHRPPENGHMRIAGGIRLIGVIRTANTLSCRMFSAFSTLPTLLQWVLLLDHYM